MQKLDKLTSYIVKHSHMSLDKDVVKDDLKKYISDVVVDSCRFGSDDLKLGDYVKDKYDVDTKKAFPIRRKV
ncbi:MAG: hypothetical protein ACQEQD_06690 [Bacillota bacterium]